MVIAFFAQKPGQQLVFGVELLSSVKIFEVDDQMTCLLLED
jgi:hypothetical protein